MGFYLEFDGFVPRLIFKDSGAFRLLVSQAFVGRGMLQT